MKNARSDDDFATTLARKRRRIYTYNNSAEKRAYILRNTDLAITRGNATFDTERVLFIKAVAALPILARERILESLSYAYLRVIYMFSTFNADGRHPDEERPFVPILHIEPKRMAVVSMDEFLFFREMLIQKAFNCVLEEIQCHMLEKADRLHRRVIPYEGAPMRSTCRRFVGGDDDDDDYHGPCATSSVSQAGESPPSSDSEEPGVPPILSSKPTRQQAYFHTAKRCKYTYAKPLIMRITCLLPYEGKRCAHPIYDELNIRLKNLSGTRSMEIRTEHLYCTTTPIYPDAGNHADIEINFVYRGRIVFLISGNRPTAFDLTTGQIIAQNTETHLLTHCPGMF